MDTPCFLRSFPLLVAALTFLPNHSPAEPAKPQAASIAAELQPFVDSRVLAGAVTCVASKDKILSLEAVGFADVAAKKPMKTDALFWIASQTKPITAAALMILVDEGKVSVDDPVEKYLPEFKGQMLAGKPGEPPTTPAHPITVRNVLTHTSGLPFKTDIEQPTLDLFPLAKRVESYAKTPLQFEPDTKYQYSNAGINTAGRIIEVVSGMPYEKFLDERLFEPLGMKDTTFWPHDEQLTRLAKSYKGNKDKPDLEETQIGQLKYPLNDPTRQPMPAGGLFSTAEDVARFCQLLLNGGEFNGKRIISAASVKQMTSRQTGEKIPTGYGFGFSTGAGTFSHGGAYSTSMSVDSQRGLITIFMVQNAGWRNDDGKKIQPAFNKAAMNAFSK